MIGLALQGGGTRGAYQAGAYEAFLKCHIKFDGVCGTSIGAINGLMIASGKKEQIINFWQNIDIGELLNFDEDYLNDLKEDKFNLKNILKNSFKILKNGGIDNKGLIKFLKEKVDPKELKESKMDYGLVTVKLDNFKITPMYVFKEDIPEDKIFDYVMASCYLPIFKMEKSIDDHYYLDGGFYDNSPINMLLNKGYKKIYVVELNPFLNIQRKVKHNAEIIRITPKRSLGGVLTLDEDSIKEYIKMGYYDTLRVLKKMDGFYYCFKKRPNFYYDFIIRNIDREEIKKLKSFFNAKSNKELIIKALEYIMRNENIDFYKIYKVENIIKYIKNNCKKKHFVYEFVRQIKFL